MTSRVGRAIPAFDDVQAAAGRRSPEDITVFDSSGIALQDLSVATALLDAHEGTIPDGPM